MGQATLILRKVAGSLQTFGIGDTARRCLKELARALRSRAPGHLDISEVHPRVLVGAAPRVAALLPRLAAAGVTDVLDLRAERRPTDLLARTETVRVHWVPTYDDWRPKDRAFYATVVGTARKVWRAHPAARLLVCCGAGEHRAPLAAALVLADILGDLDGALRQVAAARPAAEFLPTYETSLRAFWTAGQAA